MDKENFCKYLQGRNLSEEKIEQSVLILEKFEAFLNDSGRYKVPGKITSDDVRDFSARLIEEKLNTFDNLVTLILYGRFAKNNGLVVGALELIDGTEAMNNLYERLAQEVGEQKRDEVFAGIELPPLGTRLSHLPEVTQIVMERLENLIDPTVTIKLLKQSLRDLPDEWYQEGKKKYHESDNLDDYLQRKGRDFIAQLEKIRDENGLFFTQPITDEVIEFVRSNPEILQGVREGNIIYETKIPCMTAQYLAETDERMKKYYYCHCPWVKESIMRDDVNVPASFCNCSVGFHKKSWEMIFDQPLEAEVLESVLKGDDVCRFAIHLPEGAV